MLILPGYFFLVFENLSSFLSLRSLTFKYSVSYNYSLTFVDTTDHATTVSNAIRHISSRKLCSAVALTPITTTNRYFLQIQQQFSHFFHNFRFLSF